MGGGIAQTSASLTEIAQEPASNEHCTAQVSLAMEQVAQVVQTNSATSQQSAAASEELSSQAQSLQALIAQFKLRGREDARPLGLPPMSELAAERDMMAAPIIF